MSAIHSPYNSYILTTRKYATLSENWLFLGAIMSSDKYLSKCSHHIDAIVYVILQKFFATRAVWKIGEYHSDIAQSVLAEEYSVT